MDLIESLVKQGWLKTPIIIDAFRNIKRRDFLPKEIEKLAEINEAFPIGFGQTISQPLVVAFMLENLEPRSGQKILDIGSGSGWTTALLSYIISKGGQSLKGRVIALEIIPELKEFGEKNVAKYNFIKREIAKFICADGSKGYKKEAPYDRILVSAALEGEIPSSWKEQLKVGGKIVVPIGSSIWVLTKKTKEHFEKQEFPGFVFVPLVEKK